MLAFLLFGCNGKYISKNEVKNIVIKDARVESENVRFVEIDLDREDGIYDVEFIADGIRYEYEVDARSGDIIVDDDFILYSSKDAESIALEDAGYYSNNVKIFDNDTQTVDGKTVYNIKFWDDSEVCEYVVGANRWQIISGNCAEINNNTSATDYLSVDEVKNLVINYLSVDAGSVQFVEIDLDREDGIYDVDFVLNGVKYDYEVDAKNGNIRLFD